MSTRTRANGDVEYWVDGMFVGINETGRLAAVEALKEATK